MSDQTWDAELVGRLTDLADPANPNRAVLAHLRRGLVGPPDYTLGRVGWLFRRVRDEYLTHAVVAAGLFAWVKGDCRHRPEINFGTAFGTGLTQEGKQRRERRFIDLLDTDARELPYKLRQAITLIPHESVGLDWVLLIRHLRHWADHERWVQKKWARGFWAAAEADATTANQQALSQ
jgi:CRISPR system Cascade subunit CasB